MGKRCITLSQNGGKKAILVLLFFIQCVNRSYGTQYSAAFRTVNKGYRLSKDFILKEKDTYSALECAQLCLIHSPSCKSVNFEVNNGQSSMRNCQLGNSTKKGNPSNLIQDKSFDYLEPIKKPEMLPVEPEQQSQAELASGAGVSEPTVDPILFEPFSANFTTLGATGRIGPTLIGTHYAGQDHNSMVSVSKGIQQFTVPFSGIYEISAVGAAGGYDTSGSTYRGRGALVTGLFSLSQGDVLQILVGQQGLEHDKKSSGGGGGTFVERNEDPMIVAGGGGGITATTKHRSECDAATTNAGKGNGCGLPDYCTDWSGGVYGEGATQADGGPSGGGGGGFDTDGGSAASYGGQIGVGGEGGKSFQNGGDGGNSIEAGAVGGFGGGGGGGGNANSMGFGSGGGGGYSGGARGDSVEQSCGGGGGSFNLGTNPSSSEGYSSGDGSLRITRIS